MSFASASASALASPTDKTTMIYNDVKFGEHSNILQHFIFRLYVFNHSCSINQKVMHLSPSHQIFPNYTKWFGVYRFEMDMFCYFIFFG